MKFLKLFVCILLKPMLRKSEQVWCSLYHPLYFVREQLASLLAQDEYKHSETLQTLHGEHSTIEENILKTFFTAVKRALTKTILWAYSYSIGPVFKWTLRRRNETHLGTKMIKTPNACFSAARNRLKVARSDFWVTIPFNFERLEQHHSVQQKIKR